jgi:prevent-host-death family protein
MIETVNSRTARENWRDLLDNIVAGGDVVIERNGKPVAAMIPIDDFNALQDHLEDLRDARRVAEIYEAYKRDPSAARPYEEVRSEMVRDGLLDG